MIEMRKKIQSDLNESKKQMRKRCGLVLREQKQELIAEFLRDWRWGRVFKKHRKSHRLKYRCICHIASWEFWKWFEEKWEKRLEESLKN